MPSRSATPRKVLCVPPTSDESISLTQPAQVSCSETCCGAASLNSLSKRVKTLLAACCAFPAPSHRSTNGRSPWPIDRKSTRLNSSHGYISYAVFCLKKKNKKFVFQPVKDESMVHLQDV